MARMSPLSDVLAKLTLMSQNFTQNGGALRPSLGDNWMAPPLLKGDSLNNPTQYAPTKNPAYEPAPGRMPVGYHQHSIISPPVSDDDQGHGNIVENGGF